jgi:acyl dehydratase
LPDRNGDPAPGGAEEVIEFDLPVERGKVREFALAVGEDNPIHLDPEAARLQGFPDVVAPPTFTVTQIWQVPREEREVRLGANLDYGRVLHGEQEFVYKRLPFAGEVLKGRMRISKDFTKEGRRGGSMRFVTYESVFTDAEGEEVLTAYYTLIETAKDPGS